MNKNIKQYKHLETKLSAASGVIYKLRKYIPQRALIHRK